MGPPVVVIGKSEQAVGLRKRLGDEAAVAVFSDCESLKALESILALPPRILALDRGFAATARGAALVARVRSEPSLCATDIRVLAEDEDNLPVLLNARNPGSEATVLRASHPLDYCGTRRAPRFPVAGAVSVVVNGECAQLVDLSCTGAQVLVSLRLRPLEALRIALADGAAELKLRGVVAWSVAEPSGAVVAYRAGLEFINPESLTLEAFCVRHIGGGDR